MGYVTDLIRYSPLFFTLPTSFETDNTQSLLQVRQGRGQFPLLYLSLDHEKAIPAQAREKEPRAYGQVRLPTPCSISRDD